MRSLELTLAVLFFGFIMSLFSTFQLMPDINAMGTSHWDSTDVNNMLITQNVTSSDMTGYNGYFTQGMSVLGKIFNIIVGTLVVAKPICDIWGYSLFVMTVAGMIQTVCGVLVAYDLLYLWRGISWRSG